MRFPALLSLVVLASLAISACDETKVVAAPTQIMLRIASTDETLLEGLTHVRASVSLREGDTWKKPVVATLAKDALRWPVDIPILPRVSADALKQFEVVVEALAGDEVLAQGRAVTSFVPNERRVLEMWLYACAVHEESFVCADTGCHGETCTACTMSGICAPVGVTTPDSLRPLDPGGYEDGGMDASGPAEVDGDAAADADDIEADIQAGPPTEYALGEANMPCASELEQTLACEGHASRQVLKCQEGIWQVLQTCALPERCESRVGPDQGMCAPVHAACVGRTAGAVCEGETRRACGLDLLSVIDHACQANAHCIDDGSVRCACDSGYESDGQGGCRNIDDCPGNACQHGSVCQDGLQDYSCLCDGTGYLGKYCDADVNECAGANLCASPDYPCIQGAPPGYTCLGQFADWHMPDALVGSKFAPSYDTSTAPGLVIDRVTGLVWQRDVPATYSGCSGTSNTQGDSCTWYEAKLYCNALTLSNSNWRLPTKIELESIVDETRAAPSIDSEAFPNTPTALIFWSSSSATGGAYGVAFTTGFTMASLLSVGDSVVYGRVRCVRIDGAGTRSAMTPAERYLVDMANDTVTDMRTELVWQRTGSGTVHSWDDARAHCAGLGGNWRLPALKELLTLVDPTRAPAIDPIFSGGPELFWSASPVVNMSGRAWSVYFSTGQSIGYATSDALRLRCVR
jgi:hypothetical protein